MLLIVLATIYLKFMFLLCVFFFFFNDTATTEIYTLSYTTLFRSDEGDAQDRCPRARAERARGLAGLRSEEHTSELQSRRDLVCRLLLEKKKNKTELMMMTS